MDSASSYPTRLAEILAEEERSAAWLGRRLGVSRQRASRFVTGECHPGERNRQKIAHVLERKIDDVFPSGGVQHPVDANKETLA